MSTHVNPPSQTSDVLTSGNGLDEDTESKAPERKYKLEDFSQSAINRGQQYINYELTVVNDKIVEALNALKNVIAQAPGGDAIDFKAVEKAISEVSKANKKVAGWFPPGCVSGSVKTGGETERTTGGETGGTETPPTVI